MSLENVAEGFYNASIVDYGVSKKEGKLPQLSIKFKFNNNGSEEHITWYGHLSDKAKPYTMKALAKIGLSNPAAIETFGMGKASGLLDLSGDYSIKVNVEQYEGKTMRKVGWIGTANSSGNNYLNEDEAINSLKGLNLVGEAMAAVQSVNSGVAKPNGAASNNAGF